jgi:hypothetical protein
MFRLLTVLLLAHYVIAAPAPKDKEVFYFPTHVGDKLVYEISSAERMTERTDTVLAVEVKSGAFIVSIASSTTSGTRPAIKTRVSAQGMFSIFDGRQDIDPPTPLLKLPAKAGDTWEVKSTENKLGSVTGHTSKVIGEEDVQVPAGKFKTIRVDSIYSLSGEQSIVSQWFAPDVGLVKMVNGGGSRTTVLKSFTPGR